MNFINEEKKKLNDFLDKYEYLLEEGDYVTFLKKYREQNKNIRNELYYTLVDLIKNHFDLTIESFIKDDPDFYWLNYIDENTSITHINIPAGVTTIGSYAFYNCDSLTSITIPNSVTTIGEYAFYNCSSLTAVTFGENSQLTTIGFSAFYGCSSLTSIMIPDSITTIGSYVFEYCTSLTSITIPDSVTTIGSRAFAGCSNLIIWCEATSKPSGWYSDWNPHNCPVIKKK